MNRRTKCVIARPLLRSAAHVVFALLIVCTSITVAGSTEDSGTLIVRVEGLQSNEGSLRFVMFDSKENFLKNAVRSEIIEIENQQGTWNVEDLPYGVYAVLVSFSAFVAEYPFLGVAAGALSGMTFNFLLSRNVVFQDPVNNT